MNSLFKKILLLLLLYYSAWFVNIQKTNAQPTVDSLKKRLANLSKITNTAKFSEALMQLQAIFFSDTLMFLNRQTSAHLEKTVGKKDIRYGGSITGMAILYMWRGEYQKSLPLLQEAMAIFKNANKEDDVKYPVVLNNLGLLYERMGHYDKALSFYQEGLDVRKKNLKEDNPLYPLFYPLSLSSLGSLYMQLGEYEKAQPLFEEAIEIREKKLGKEHPYYAFSVNNLASLYSSMGKYENALPLLKQTLNVYKKAFGEDDLEYVTALDNLASLYKNMGDHEQAMLFFQQVLTWRKKTLGEDNPLYASSLNNTGLLYHLSGNFDKAYSLFIQAGDITLKHLSRAYSSLSEQEKTIFLKQESAQFNYLPSLLFTSGRAQKEIINQVYANELALKGMVLEDQLQVLRSMRQSGDSNELSIYQRWRFNKALAGRQFLLPKTQRHSNIDSIAEAANQAEQELSQNSGAFRELQRIQNISTKNVAQHLEKGQAVIEFFRCKLYNKKWSDSIMYGAIVLLPKDNNAKFVPLFEEKQLKRLLMPSAKAETPVYLLYPSHIAPGKSGKVSTALYRLIWKPLEKYLQDIHTIYYAPTGLLHRIAFQALHPDPAHLLIDNYRLIQLLSTRSVALTQKAGNVKPLSASVWGDIQYNFDETDSAAVTGINNMDTAASFFNLYAWDTRGKHGKEWEALPETKKEIDNIKNVLHNAGVNIAISSATRATEEDFKALDSKSPDVLHIATHGFFLPVEETKLTNTYNAGNDNNAFTVQQNPMFRSGLVLAGGNHAWKGEDARPGREDGILTAYEIAQMDLSNTQLVVLSACETALGDIQGNEGVIGLQRAFKIAGVKQLVLSLWRVSDRETMELMTLFYKNWLSGKTTRDALRYAQLNMKKKYPPYYWAGFVLIE